MAEQEEIDKAFKIFMSHVEGHVMKGHPLPNRATSRLGLEGLDSVLRTMHHGGRMALESVAEAVLWNKRKVVGPVAGAGTGVAVAALTAGAMSGPQAGIVLGAGLAVGLAALAVQQGIRVKGYHDARKDVENLWQEGKIDIEKLFNAVNLGGLSDLARSFEKARVAQAEFMRKVNDIPFEVGPHGTCFRAAECAYRLMYWYKRCGRLFEDGARGDHRLRNVRLFVDLVPRKLLADAEANLNKYGRFLVDFLTKTAKAPTQASTGSAPQNEGLLKWADWARECSSCPKDLQASWRAKIASLAGYGRAAGDPMRLVQYFNDVVKFVKVTDTSQLHSPDAKQVAQLASSPRYGGSDARHIKDTAKNQIRLPAAALNIARPVTAVVVKELLNAGLLHAALSNGLAWGISAATGTVAGAIAPVVSAFSTMAAEALNSELNLRSIFDQNTDPATKVRLIRDNLEAGGSAEVMHLRDRIEASIAALKALEKQKMVFDGDVESMVKELYNLHQYVVRLVVQSVLWELLLLLILDGQEEMKRVLGAASQALELVMKWRLKDDGSGLNSCHRNCKSACYRIDATTGSPVFPLLRA